MGSWLCVRQFESHPPGHPRWSQELVNCQAAALHHKSHTRNNNSVLFLYFSFQICAYEEAYDRGTLLVITWLAGCVFILAQQSQFILLLY